jgi:5-methylcytosine-specific restriction endonuclease McrA
MNPKMTQALREQIFAKLLDAKKEGVCVFCKKRVSRKHELSHSRRATLDHIVPKSKGGLNCVDNFQITCRDCNTRRGALSSDRYRQRLNRMRG